ncbi:MAG: MFS transporter [Acidobacteria bacterium]|nr:MFS transporter [Acidobacteriota bacterium]
MAYRLWLMVVLITAYTFAFVDRVIVAVIGPAIIREFGLSDVEFGLLGGLAFALLFSACGIPVARLAERRSRVLIIGSSIAVWSLMTALFGTARSYAGLLIYRLGVGIGEAGVVPASHSLLSDTFPAHRRASMLALFTLGAPLGAVAGSVAGGWLSQMYGWRTAMAAVGLPGLVLALLVIVTLREPVRGALDRHGAAAAPPPFRNMMRGLFRDPVFGHMVMGASLTSVAATGINLFGPTYLVRRFGIGMADAGLWFGVVAGASGVAGILAGGFMTDLAARRHVRWYAGIPAFGVALAFPLYVVAFRQETVAATLGYLVAGAVSLTTYMGPTFALAQNIVSARMRASASAVVLLAMNVLGQGLGPTLMGVASDAFASRAFMLGDYRTSCFGAGAVPAIADACARASTDGLQASIVVTAGCLAWGAVHFWRAATALGRRPHAIAAWDAPP